NYFLNIHSILIITVFLLPIIGSANYIENTGDENDLLSFKNKKSDELCGKDFYINELDISLSVDGYLSVSLIQFSKTSEGYTTHLSIEMLDGDGRILTV